MKNVIQKETTIRTALKGTENYFLSIDKRNDFLPLYEIRKVGHIKNNAGHFHERENFPYYSIILTIKGRAFITFEGTKYEVGPGMLFYMDMMKKNTIEVKEGEWEIYSINIRGSESPNFYYYLSKDGKNFINNYQGKFIEIVERIMGHLRNKSSNDYFTSSCCYSIWMDLVENKDESLEYDSNNSIILNAIKYINDHYKEESNIKELCREIGVSPHYFSRIFKSEVKMTPREYVNDKRLRESMFLLRNTSLKIEEIAYRCGYGNKANFYNNFTKSVEMTPKQYRNSSKLGISELIDLSEVDF